MDISVDEGSATEQQFTDLEGSMVMSESMTIAERDINITPQRLFIQNIDLLERAFEFFEEGSILDIDHNDAAKPPTARNLLAASLTSKQFFDPAMNVLWRHMSSLLPIFCILPQLVRTTMDGDSVYSLTGVVLEEHAQRVLLYSRRVRTLRLSQSPEPFGSISEAIYYIAAAQLMHFRPFTNLNRLSIAVESLPHSQRNVLLLMGSKNVAAIDFQNIGAESEIMAAALLHTLTYSGTTLKSLSVSGQLTTLFLDILPSCINMHSLSLNLTSSVIPRRTLEHLSLTTRSLENLEVTADASCVYQLEQDPASASSPLIPSNVCEFSALHALALSGPLLIACQLLEGVHLPLLRKLSLTFTSFEPDNSSTSNFSKCIQKCMALNGVDGKDNLREINIFNKAVIAAEGAIPFASFSPFLGLSKEIQVLHINIPRLLIPQATFEVFFRVGNWPKLKELQLLYEHHSDANAGMGLTVAALFILAVGAPQLTSLRISIDCVTTNARAQVQEIESIENRLQGTSARNSNLKTIRLGRLPKSWKYSASYALMMASIIDQLFPALLSASYDNPRRSQWWRDVLDMCNAFRRVRQKERRAVLLGIASSHA